MNKAEKLLELFAKIDEARIVQLTSEDKKVMNSFLQEKPAKGKNIYTDGKILDLMGSKSTSEIATWRNGELKVSLSPNFSSDEKVVLDYMKFSYPDIILDDVKKFLNNSKR